MSDIIPSVINAITLLYQGLMSTGKTPAEISAAVEAELTRIDAQQHADEAEEQAIFQGGGNV